MLIVDPCRGVSRVDDLTQMRLEPDAFEFESHFGHDSGVSRRLTAKRFAEGNRDKRSEISRNWVATRRRRSAAARMRSNSLNSSNSIMSETRRLPPHRAT
eukprot:scaffold1422_cov114-Alexandrium_tamarense.AAC.3